MTLGLKSNVSVLTWPRDPLRNKIIPRKPASWAGRSNCNILSLKYSSHSRLSLVFFFFYVIKEEKFFEGHARLAMISWLWRLSTPVFSLNSLHNVFFSALLLKRHNYIWMLRPAQLDTTCGFNLQKLICLFFSYRTHFYFFDCLFFNLALIWRNDALSTVRRGWRISSATVARPPGHDFSHVPLLHFIVA